VAPPDRGHAADAGTGAGRRLRDRRRGVKEIRLAATRAPSPPETTASPPAGAWSDAMQEVARGRQAFRVPAQTVTTHEDPDRLPEVPRESNGLFELVNPVARRALELGLASREPSFHVFVAAAPEVMIEDDIVRHALRYAQGRPAPPDIVYVHDFDRPEAPRPIMLPAGLGPALVAAMDAVIAKLRAEIPSIVPLGHRVIVGHADGRVTVLRPVP